MWSHAVSAVNPHPLLVAAVGKQCLIRLRFMSNKSATQLLWAHGKLGIVPEAGLIEALEKYCRLVNWVVDEPRVALIKRLMSPALPEIIKWLVS